MYCVCVLLGPSHQRHSLKAFQTCEGAGMRVKAPSVALLHTNVCFCTEVSDILVLTLPFPLKCKYLMVTPRRCKNGVMQVGPVWSEWGGLLPDSARAGAVYFSRGLTGQVYSGHCLHAVGASRASVFWLCPLGSKLNSYHSNSPQRTSSGSPGPPASAVFFPLTPFLLFFNLFFSINFIWK